MIRDTGDRLEVSGPLTLGVAREMLEAGSALISRPEITFLIFPRLRKWTPPG
ncbi:MAG: hypothetical protein M5R42_10215 [Rhodocyclaceae bacterium]|nr:hypothetical protein [Rhodocyclaceae bacterium]